MLVTLYQALLHTRRLIKVALLFITTRGQVDTSGSVEAAVPLAVVWIKYAAQFNFSQFHHFSHMGAFVLQRQLVRVDQNRVKAALETLQDQWVLRFPSGALVILHLVEKDGRNAMNYQSLL